MRHTKAFSAAALIALGSGILVAAPALSAPPGAHLNWGHQLNAGDDACPPGKKILNINYRIANSVDSGTGANDFGAVWWAYIDYVLQVQVVEIDVDTFCARVKTQGKFESVGGDGPGCAQEATCGLPAGRLEPGVTGTFQGGYTGTFTGMFMPGAQRTKGSIGSFDHDCDAAAADGGCDGSGVSRWLGLYFTGVAGGLFDWWGWVYHGGNNGSWINQIDGNFGNITGD